MSDQPQFDLADLFQSGGSGDQILSQAIVDAGARFEGQSLAAMLFIQKYNSELAQEIKSHASRWHNVKHLMEALKYMTLWDKLAKINLGGGGGK